MQSFFDHLKAFAKRHSRLRLLVGRVLDRVLYPIVLLPFRRPQKPGSTSEDPELLKRTDEYNAAAERYFATYADASQLLDKPFSDVEGFAEHLIRVGTLLSAARIRPGDTIVEIGAGTCWLSHLLNRYGCHTVAVDVSRTALDIGKKLFEREPSTDWSLDPRFVVYDGRGLPLDDGVCDCVVVYDAFHHIPNQRRLLSEMRRVLRPHGMVVMSEPGCVFRPKWNTDFGRSGTSISAEVEHRFREVEHRFRDVEHPFRGKWNAGSGVVNARR